MTCEPSERRFATSNTSHAHVTKLEYLTGLYGSRRSLLCSIYPLKGWMGGPSWYRGVVSGGYPICSFRQFLARMCRFATIQIVTDDDDRQTDDIGYQRRPYGRPKTVWYKRVIEAGTESTVPSYSHCCPPVCVQTVSSATRQTRADFVSLRSMTAVRPPARCGVQLTDEAQSRSADDPHQLISVR